MWTGEGFIDKCTGRQQNDLVYLLLMFEGLLLLVACGFLSGIDKKLDRIADILSETKYGKNEEKNDDQ